MKHFLILGGLLMAASFIAPVAVMADRDDHGGRRYYDRDVRDYHMWNDREDRAYRVYLVEQRREYRVFPKVRPPQQREYFRWRHEHPDRVLFKVEIR
jgi:hypothetical protein